VDADRVVRRQRHESEGCRKTFGLIQLALDDHRGGSVDEDADRDLVVGFMELDQDLIETGEDVIVDSSKIVPGVVLTEIGEVHGVAVPLGAVLAAEPADQPMSTVELETLQPRHERRAEKAQGTPRMSGLGSPVVFKISAMIESDRTPSAVAS